VVIVMNDYLPVVCPNASNSGAEFEMLTIAFDHRLHSPGGFAAFEPKGFWPATRAAVREK
jgi:hypothetical protein